MYKVHTVEGGKELILQEVASTPALHTLLRSTYFSDTGGKRFYYYCTCHTDTREKGRLTGFLRRQCRNEHSGSQQTSQTELAGALADGICPVGPNSMTDLRDTHFRASALANQQDCATKYHDHSCQNGYTTWIMAVWSRCLKASWLLKATQWKGIPTGACEIQTVPGVTWEAAAASSPWPAEGLGKGLLYF